MWKMHGRLSGTGILHGNRSSDMYTLVHIGENALDDFQFTVTICTGQYESFKYTYSPLLDVLLNWFNRRQRGFVLA